MLRGIGRLRAGGGASAAFTPASLFTGGVQGAWYDPSDLSSMWQDSAGTTPAAVGSPVGKILDKSGNGNHATQATSTARPILTQDGNGKYYLSFDGVDDYLQGTAALSGAALYFAAALQLNGSAAFGRIFAFWNNPSYLQDYPNSQTIAVLHGNTATNIGTYRNSAERATVSVTGDVRVIVEAGSDSAGSFAARNGGTDTVAVYAAPANFSITDFRLGAAGATLGSYNKDGFYGGLFIAKAATGAERSNVVGYLNSKAGAF